MAENNFKASLRNAKTIVVDQTQPGVKAKINPSASTLLPAYLQTNTNKKLLDTSLDLISRSGSLEQVQGYSYDSESIPESAHENQINNGMDDVTVFATNSSSSYNYNEFLNALNSQNFDIQNNLGLENTPQLSYYPQIDIDKFINFKNYVWYAHGLPIIGLLGVTQSIVNNKINYTTPLQLNGKTLKFENGMRVVLIDEGPQLYRVTGVGRNIQLIAEQNNVANNATSVLTDIISEYNIIYTNSSNETAEATIDTITTSATTGYVTIKLSAEQKALSIPTINWVSDGYALSQTVTKIVKSNIIAFNVPDFVSTFDYEVVVESDPGFIANKPIQFVGQQTNAEFVYISGSDISKSTITITKNGNHYLYSPIVTNNLDATQNFFGTGVISNNQLTDMTVYQNAIGYNANTVLNSIGGNIEIGKYVQRSPDYVTIAPGKIYNQWSNVNSWVDKNTILAVNDFLDLEADFQIKIDSVDNPNANYPIIEYHNECMIYDELINPTSVKLKVSDTFATNWSGGTRIFQNIQLLEDDLIIDHTNKTYKIGSADAASEGNVTLEAYLQSRFVYVSRINNFYIAGTDQTPGVTTHSSPTGKVLFDAVVNVFESLLDQDEDGVIDHNEQLINLENNFVFIIGHQNITDIEETAIATTFNKSVMTMKSDIWAFNPDFNIETFNVDIMALASSSWRPIGWNAVYEEVFHTITEAVRKQNPTAFSFAEGSTLGDYLEADIGAGTYETTTQNVALGGPAYSNFSEYYTIETAVKEYLHQIFILAARGQESILNQTQKDVLAHMRTYLVPDTIDRNYVTNMAIPVNDGSLLSSTYALVDSPEYVVVEQGTSAGKLFERNDITVTWDEEYAKSATVIEPEFKYYKNDNTAFVLTVSGTSTTRFPLFTYKKGTDYVGDMRLSISSSDDLTFVDYYTLTGATQNIYFKFGSSGAPSDSPNIDIASFKNIWDKQAQIPHNKDYVSFVVENEDDDFIYTLNDTVFLKVEEIHFSVENDTLVETLFYNGNKVEYRDQIILFDISVPVKNYCNEPLYVYDLNNAILTTINKGDSTVDFTGFTNTGLSHINNSVWGFAKNRITFLDYSKMINVDVYVNKTKLETWELKGNKLVIPIIGPTFREKLYLDGVTDEEFNKPYTLYEDSIFPETSLQTIKSLANKNKIVIEYLVYDNATVRNYDPSYFSGNQLNNNASELEYGELFYHLNKINTTRKSFSNGIAHSSDANITCSLSRHDWLMRLANDSIIDVIDLIALAGREYENFKKFLFKNCKNYISANTDASDTPAIMKEMFRLTNAGKNINHYYIYSHMVGYTNATSTTKTISSGDTIAMPLARVTDSWGNTNIVNVYLDKQILTYDIDYTISGSNVTVTIPFVDTKSVTIDCFTIDSESFIPYSTRALRFGTLHKPEIFRDKQGPTDVWVLIGHDDCAYKLETIDGTLSELDKCKFYFETSIYNTLQEKQKTITVKPYEPISDTDPKMIDWSKRYFESWASTFNLPVNYDNIYFDSADGFTWNYSLLEGVGHWRGLYKKYFNTDRPDILPWRMLGYTNKPVWWDVHYSWTNVAKRVAFIDTLEIGLVSEPGQAKTFDSRYITNLVPVDTIGTLISPDKLGFGSGLQQHEKSEIMLYSSYHPYEGIYKRTSEYQFIKLSYEMRKNPFKIFNLCDNSPLVNIRDTSFEYVNCYEYLDTKSHENEFDVITSAEPVGNIGIKRFLLSVIQRYKNAKDMFTVLADAKTLTFNCGFNVNGFTAKDKASIFNQGVLPNTTSREVNDNDYNFKIHESPSKYFYEYSLIRIVKENYQYKVMGFLKDRQFPYYEWNTVSDSKKIANGRAYIYTQYQPTKKYMQFGSMLRTVNQVVELVYGYFKCLGEAGFTVQTGTRDQALEEFIDWAGNNWANGNFIDIGLFNDEIKLTIDGGYVSTLDSKYFIIQNGNGVSYVSDSLSSVKEGNQLTINVLGTDQVGYIYVNPIITNQALIFNNTSNFGGTFYNSTTGSTLAPVYANVLRTTGWNGSVEIPGYVYLNNEIQPNLNSLINEIEKDYLSNESFSWNDTLEKLGRRNLGYLQPEWAASMGFDENFIFNYIQSVIAKKGTTEALKNVVLQDPLKLQGNSEISLEEGWLLKRSEYGVDIVNTQVEFEYDSALTKANPQLISFKAFVDNQAGDLPTDNVITVLPGDHRLVTPLEAPLTFLTRPIYDYSETPQDQLEAYAVDLPSAGYVRVDEATKTLFYKYNMPTLHDENSVFSNLPVYNPANAYVKGTTVRHLGQLFKATQSVMAGYDLQCHRAGEVGVERNEVLKILLYNFIDYTTQQSTANRPVIGQSIALDKIGNASEYFITYVGTEENATINVGLPTETVVACTPIYIVSPYNAPDYNWTSGGTVTLDSQIISGENVYTISFIAGNAGSGTLGATAPTHTTGSVVNGDCTLTYVADNEYATWLSTYVYGTIPGQNNLMWVRNLNRDTTGTLALAADFKDRTEYTAGALLKEYGRNVRAKTAIALPGLEEIKGTITALGLSPDATEVRITLSTLVLQEQNGFHPDGTINDDVLVAPVNGMSFSLDTRRFILEYTISEVTYSTRVENISGAGYTFIDSVNFSIPVPKPYDPWFTSIVVGTTEAFVFGTNINDDGGNWEEVTDVINWTQLVEANLMSVWVANNDSKDWEYLDLQDLDLNIVEVCEGVDTGDEGLVKLNKPHNLVKGDYVYITSTGNDTIDGIHEVTGFPSGTCDYCDAADELAELRQFYIDQYISNKSYKGKCFIFRNTRVNSTNNAIELAYDSKYRLVTNKNIYVDNFDPYGIYKYVLQSYLPLRIMSYGITDINALKIYNIDSNGLLQKLMPNLHFVTGNLNPNVTIANEGRGYGYAPSVHLTGGAVAETSQTGTLTANATVIGVTSPNALTYDNIQVFLDSVELLPAIDYTLGGTKPNWTVTVTGTTSDKIYKVDLLPEEVLQAKLSTVVLDGELASINIDNPGTNYVVTELLLGQRYQQGTSVKIRWKNQSNETIYLQNRILNGNEQNLDIPGPISLIQLEKIISQPSFVTVTINDGSPLEYETALDAILLPANATAWAIGTTYDLDAQVVHLGVNYKSLADNNVGNYPNNALSLGTWWEVAGATLSRFSEWSNSIDYSTGDHLFYDNLLYKASQPSGPNFGGAQTPGITSDYWDQQGGTWGYSVSGLPTFELQGGLGSEATAQAVLAGYVTNVRVDNSGGGFNRVPSLTFSAPEVTGGTIAAGTPHTRGPVIGIDISACDPLYLGETDSSGLNHSKRDHVFTFPDNGLATHQENVNTTVVFTYAAHGMAIDAPITFTASNPGLGSGAGDLPNGVSEGITYYVQSGATGGTGGGTLASTFCVSNIPGGAKVPWTSGFQGPVNGAGHALQHGQPVSSITIEANDNTYSSGDGYNPSSAVINHADISYAPGGSVGTISTLSAGNGSYANDGTGGISTFKTNEIPILSVPANTWPGGTTATIVVALEILDFNVYNAGTGYSEDDILELDISIPSANPNYSAFAVPATFKVDTIDVNNNNAIQSLSLVASGNEIYELGATFTSAMDGGTGANLNNTGDANGTSAQLSNVRFVIKKYRVLNGGVNYTAPIWITVAGENINSGTKVALGWDVGMSGYGTFKSVAGEDYIAMTNNGNDYHNQPAVEITGDADSNFPSAAAHTGVEAKMNAVIHSVTVDDPGNGYANQPNPTLSNATWSSSASLIGELQTSVFKINVTNGGFGYVVQPTIEIDTPSSSVGVQATANAVIDPITGKVTGITMTNSGSEYDALPVVRVRSADIPYYVSSVGGPAVGGTGYLLDEILELADAGIADSAGRNVPAKFKITQINGGTGAVEMVEIYDDGSKKWRGEFYTYNQTATYAVTGGSGTSVTLNLSFTSDRASVTLGYDNIDFGGGIESFVVTSSGSGYTSGPDLLVTRLLGTAGSSIEAQPRIRGAIIDYSQISFAGRGYTQPPNLHVRGGGGENGILTVEGLDEYFLYLPLLTDIPDNYSTTTEYIPGQGVKHGGIIYACTRTALNIEPTVTVNWALYWKEVIVSHNDILYMIDDRNTLNTYATFKFQTISSVTCFNYEEILDPATGKIVFIYSLSAGFTDYLKKQRVQMPKSRTDQIANISLYDSVSLQTKALFEQYDPFKGVIPGVVQGELDVIAPFDKAVYTNSNDDSYQNNNVAAWSNRELGRTWWDLDKVKYLEYEIDDNEYASAYWGEAFPGSSMDVYEWTESPVLPGEWENLVANSISYNDHLLSGIPYYKLDTDDETKLYYYTTKEEYNVATNNTETKYYFWVKDKKYIENDALGRTFTSDKLSLILTSPTNSEVNWFGINGDNGLVVANLQLFADKNTIFQINFEGPKTYRHVDWGLIYPSDTSLPGFAIDTMKNSLASQLDFPIAKYFEYFDATLTYKYGSVVLYRDDKELPVTTTKTTDGGVRNFLVGTSVIDKRLVEVRVNNNPAPQDTFEMYNDTLIFDVAPVPSSVIEVDIYQPGFYIAHRGAQANSFSHETWRKINSYRIAGENEIRILIDKNVPDIDLNPLEMYGTEKRPKPKSWIKDIYLGRQVFVQEANRLLANINISDSIFTPWESKLQNITYTAFDNLNNTVTVTESITDYWGETDWSAPGYEDIIPEFYYDKRQDFITADKTGLKVVKVNNDDGSGNYAIYQNIDDNWIKVKKKSGTIKISDKLWDTTLTTFGWNKDLWNDQDFDLNLNFTFATIFDVLVNEIFIESFSQNTVTLWFELSNYMVSENKPNTWYHKSSMLKVDISDKLEQPAYQQPDNVDNLESVINEFKPYRTKIGTITKQKKLDEPVALDYTNNFQMIVQTGPAGYRSPRVIQNAVEYKGTWAPNYVYKTTNIVYYQSIYYLCLADHTSSGMPGAILNTDADFWSLLITDITAFDNLYSFRMFQNTQGVFYYEKITTANSTKITQASSLTDINIFVESPQRFVVGDVVTCQNERMLVTQVNSTSISVIRGYNKTGKQKFKLNSLIHLAGAKTLIKDSQKFNQIALFNDNGLTLVESQNTSARDILIYGNGHIVE